MSGTLRSNHDDTHAAWCLNQSKMNGEAMRKKQCFSFGKIGLNFILVNCSLLHVWYANHDNIGLVHRFSDFHHFKAMSLGHPD